MKENLTSHLRRQEGFGLLEVLVCTAVLGILAAVAGPSLLKQDEKANDVAAKSAVFNGAKLAKLVWTENANVYPSVGELLLGMQREEPTVYSYRAHLGDISASTGPTDISVLVEDAQTIVVCARSLSARTYCGRFASAHQYVAVAVGSGVMAEEDAITALPGDETPPTDDAGPGDTGTPIDPPPPVDPEDSPLDPDDPPVDPDPPLAPLLAFTVTPAPTTTARDANFGWARGGAISGQTCKLNGQSKNCAETTALLEALPVGRHLFEVDAVGPGGADALAYNWDVITPPSDRLNLPANGDYTTASYPAPLRPDGAFEIGAWVKINSTPGGDDATIASHGCTWSNGSPCRDDAGWTLAIDNEMGVHFSVRAGGDWYDESSTSKKNPLQTGPAEQLQLGKWHYVSGSYDPNGRVCTYVDSVLQGCSGPLAGMPPQILTSSPLLIGAQVNPDGNLKAFLGGQIGELRMTQDGTVSLPLAVGPALQPGILSSLAENGSPSTFLFHFTDLSDSAGNLGELELHGNATLTSAD